MRGPPAELVLAAFAALVLGGWMIRKGIDTEGEFDNDISQIGFTICVISGGVMLLAMCAL